MGRKNRKRSRLDGSGATNLHQAEADAETQQRPAYYRPRKRSSPRRGELAVSDRPKIPASRDRPREAGVIARYGDPLRPDGGAHRPKTTSRTRGGVSAMGRRYSLNQVAAILDRRTTSARQAGRDQMFAHAHAWRSGKSLTWLFNATASPQSHEIVVAATFSRQRRTSASTSSTK